MAGVFLLFNLQALSYAPADASGHECQHQNQTGNAHFVAFVDSVGAELEAYLVFACRDVQRAQNIIGTENLGGLSVDVGFPAVGVVDFRENGRLLLTQC